MPDRTRDDATRDLLVAVLEALDIPHADTAGDRAEHDRILIERVMHARVALQAALDDTRTMPLDWTTSYLRKRLAEHPPTGYTHWGTTRTTAAGQ